MPFTRKARTIYPDTQSPFTAFQKGYEDESNKIARKEKEKKLEERQKTLWDREDTLWNQSQADYTRKLTKEKKEEQVNQYVKAIFAKINSPQSQTEQPPQMTESQAEMSPRPMGVMGSERAMSPLARQTDGEPASEGLGQPSGQNLRREPAQQLNNQGQQSNQGQQVKQLLSEAPVEIQQAIMKKLIEVGETEEGFNGMMDGMEEDRQDDILQTVVDNQDYIEQEMYQEKLYESIIDNKGKVSNKLLREDYQEYKGNVINMADTLYNDLVSKGYSPEKANEIRKAFLTENLKESPFDDVNFIDNKLNEMAINWNNVVSSNNGDGILKVIEDVGAELIEEGAEPVEVNKWIQERSDKLLAVKNKADKALTSKGKSGYQVYSDNSGNNYIELAARDIKTPEPYSVSVDLGSDFPNSNGSNLSINFPDIPQYHRNNIDEKEEQLRGARLLHDTFAVDVTSKMALANIINNRETSVSGKVPIRNIKIEIANRKSDGRINAEEEANMLRVVDDVVRLIDDGESGEKVIDLNMRNVFQSLKHDMDSLNNLAGAKLLTAVLGVGGFTGGGGVSVGQVNDKYTAQSLIQWVKSFAQGIITSQVPINEEQLLAYNVSSDVKLLRQLYGATIDGFKGSVRNAISLPHLRKQGIDLSNKMGFETYPAFVKEVLDRKAAPYISQYYEKEDFTGDGKKSNAKKSDSAPKRSSASGVR